MNLQKNLIIRGTIKSFCPSKMRNQEFAELIHWDFVMIFIRVSRKKLKKRSGSDWIDIVPLSQILEQTYTEAHESRNP